MTMLQFMIGVIIPCLGLSHGFFRVFVVSCGDDTELELALMQAQQLYVSLKGYGEGNLGTQALILTLERLNNLTLPTRNTD
jgi:hypothetical protein